MCAVLKISRSTYYYECKEKSEDTKLVHSIKEIFRFSRNNYGTRKIKVELAKQGKIISSRRIGRIMKQEGLVSSYTVAQFELHVPKCNEEAIKNILNRKFHEQPKHQVVVSDLTYVRVGNSWNYICVLVDLFHREIIGYRAGKNKNSNLVMQAFSKVKRLYVNSWGGLFLQSAPFLYFEDFFITSSLILIFRYDKKTSALHLFFFLSFLVTNEKNSLSKFFKVF